MGKKVFLAGFVILLFSGSSAFGQGLTLGVLLGNGQEDGYNFGFGGRAGVTLPVTNWYVGGRAVFHQGTEINDIDTKVQYFGVEVGKTLFSFIAKISATGVIGTAEISADIPGEETERQRKFFFSPGVIGSLPLGLFSVGLDLRYLYTKDFDGVAIYGMIGLGL